MFILVRGLINCRCNGLLIDYGITGIDMDPESGLVGRLLV